MRRFIVLFCWGKEEVPNDSSLFVLESVYNSSYLGPSFLWRRCPYTLILRLWKTKDWKFYFHVLTLSNLLLYFNINWCRMCLSKTSLSHISIFSKVRTWRKVSHPDHFYQESHTQIYTTNFNGCYGITFDFLEWSIYTVKEVCDRNKRQKIKFNSVIFNRVGYCL